MTGGYTDDGWQGGGGPCPVCGRELDECGTCRCVAERRRNFDDYCYRDFCNCDMCRGKEPDDE